MSSLVIPELGATISFVRNVRARRYVLRVTSVNEARCTVPRRGNLAEATQFVQRQKAWIRAQLEKRRAAPVVSRAWKDGHEFLFRGELVRVEFRPEDGVVRFGDQVIPHRGATENFCALIEKRMRLLATKEFPRLVHELAAQHGLRVTRVSVRAQRSRWGSCSQRGAISLNWRLVQAPPMARDYVVVHELMHLRQMNHSDKFWAEVARSFPQWREAEAWLKRHGSLIR